MGLKANTPLLAVDIGSNSIKVAQLKGSPKKYELMNLNVIPLDPEAVMDGVIRDEEVVAEALSKGLKKQKNLTPYAVSSVAGEAVIIKKIQVPKMDEKELEESIKQEAEQYIPFDIDDVRIAFHPLGVSRREEDALEDEEEKQDILLVAVQNEIIESREDVLVKAGLKPVIIDLDAFAMVNAMSISRNLAELGAVALIDLGASFSHLNIIIDGIATFSRSIPIGGNLCTQTLMSKFDADYDEAEDLKKGVIPSDIEKREIIEIIVESFDGIIEEVRKSFEFISTTSNVQVDHVFLTGGGALLQGVDGLVADRLGITAEIFDPLRGITIPRSFNDRDLLNKMAPLAMVALGLSTRRFDYFNK